MIDMNKSRGRSKDMDMDRNKDKNRGRVCNIELLEELKSEEDRLSRRRRKLSVSIKKCRYQQGL